MPEFQSITPKEGREMVKASSILFLSNWYIENALVFNYSSNKLSIEDKNKKEIKGATIGED